MLWIALSALLIWAQGPELATAAVCCPTRDFYNAFTFPCFLLLRCMFVLSVHRIVLAYKLCYTINHQILVYHLIRYHLCSLGVWSASCRQNPLVLFIWCFFILDSSCSVFQHEDVSAVSTNASESFTESTIHPSSLVSPINSSSGCLEIHSCLREEK